jgi:hypothetical protein
MITETLFYAELLRAIRTQKFRDHAVAAETDREAGNRGAAGANLTALRDSPP